MVQNLYLFASVAKSQYQLTLDSLTTLTGSSPQNFSTLVLLTSPKIIVKYEPNSKITQHEQHKLHFKTIYNDADNFDITKYKEWIMQTSDLPFISGKRKISNQTVLESYINVEKEGIIEFLDLLGYRPDMSYMIKGVRLFHGNIVMELFQLFLKKDDKLVCIDEGLYVLKCFINVERTTDVENLTNGSKELVNLQTELQGLVELETPDRNLMDSRIGIRR